MNSKTGIRREGRQYEIDAVSGDVDSFSTEALVNGVAGDGNTITSIHGDSGDRELRAVIRFPVSSTTTTSTSYERATGVNDELILPEPENLNETNIEQFEISFRGSLDNASTSDAVYAKLGGTGDAYDATEVSNPDGGYSRVSSPRATYDGRGGGNISVHMKADGGEARLRQPAAILWAVIA